MDKLSILKNAHEGCITYYVGSNVSHVEHLKNCTLICHKSFNPRLEGVILRKVDDPQLAFYKYSHQVEEGYTFNKSENQSIGSGCNISTAAIIGDDVVIGNNVTIGPNTVIYSKTSIGDGTRIDANVTIGTEGMMWVWEHNEKVFLKQLGGVTIGSNCIIGSNSAIVRGSANELTILEDNVNIAPGCNIGHGTNIGKNTHIANNVATGGSSFISPNTFLGCSTTISPGVEVLAENVVIGSGAVLTASISESGVYVGCPAKKIKETKGKLSGMPKWKNK
jgi:UDP-3-O-[3-hydroxymyristoyl] glucosamine N-acyltransferase